MFTVGMATYDDYDGVFFTVQALRLYHPLVTEVVIVDNNPESEHGKLLQKFINHSTPDFKIHYNKFIGKQSTSTRSEVFKHATNDYVVVCDSHVLFTNNAFESLKDFYLNDHKPYDFIQGPLLYDNGNEVSTHLDRTWGGQFYGQWQTSNNKAKWFEIEAQGLGCFSCKRDEWLGFNESFRGFGGEEHYIHEKYRQHGGRTICLADFKWNHKFDRPAGVPYKNILEDRFFNYILGRIELGLDFDDVYEEFVKIVPRESLNIIIEEAITVLEK